MKYTPRQQQIVNLIVKGKTIEQMCKKLKIKPPTVKMHLTAIYRKAKVRSKQEFTVKYFIAQGKSVGDRAKV